MRTGFNSFLPALFLALFVLIPFNAFGQTASDFETKYGAQKYYPVRPFSLIRPQYDVRGQMCRAEILPNHDLEPFKPYEDPVKPNEDPGEIDITEIPLYFVAPGPLYDKGDTEHRFPIYTVDVAELRSIIDELIPAKNRIGKGTAQLDMSGFGGSYRAELR
ncbi:MAG: hypothetical protein ABIP75_18315, partial [Pyrinomonadaceae bacterium]